MKFAVITIEPPATDDIYESRGRYTRFEAGIENKLPPPQVRSERPSKYLWLLSLPGGTLTLASVVHAAQAAGIPFQVLYFDQAPEVFDSPKLVP